MPVQETCGKLVVDQKGAIVCPNCRRKIRRIRVKPGSALRDVSVQCSECRFEMQVNIDQASATYTSPRH